MSIRPIARLTDTSASLPPLWHLWRSLYKFMMLKSPRNYSSSYQPVVLANDTRTGDDELRELRKASRWTKLRPFCIFIPTGISLCVLVLHTRQYKNSGKLYEWSTSSRTLVQVVVHILSSILAVFWTYSICNLISHWTRHRISNHSVNLNTLRLWSALRQGRTDWDLPWIFTLATLAFFTLTYIPATLWAGALTPSVSRKSVSGLSLLGTLLPFTYIGYSTFQPMRH